MLTYDNKMYGLVIYFIVNYNKYINEAYFSNYKPFFFALDYKKNIWQRSFIVSHIFYSLMLAYDYRIPIVKLFQLVETDN